MTRGAYRPTAQGTHRNGPARRVPAAQSGVGAGEGAAVGASVVCTTRTTQLWLTSAKPIRHSSHAAPGQVQSKAHAAHSAHSQPCSVHAPHGAPGQAQALVQAAHEAPQSQRKAQASHAAPGKSQVCAQDAGSGGGLAGGGPGGAQSHSRLHCSHGPPGQAQRRLHSGHEEHLRQSVVNGGCRDQYHSQ